MEAPGASDGQVDPFSCDRETAAPRGKQDCLMASWSDWTTCSASCQGGTQMRERLITIHPENGGKPCEPVISEMRGCNEDRPCFFGRTDRKWADWQTWSECSGLQVRYRSRGVAQHEAGSGLACEGDVREVEPCVQKDQSHTAGECVKGTYLCMWQVWGPWSDCSATCGSAAVQKRHRMLQVSTAAEQNSLDRLLVTQALEEPEFIMADVGARLEESQRKFSAVKRESTLAEMMCRYWQRSALMCQSSIATHMRNQSLARLVWHCGPQLLILDRLVWMARAWNHRMSDVAVMVWPQEEKIAMRRWTCSHPIMRVKRVWNNRESNLADMMCRHWQRSAQMYQSSIATILRNGSMARLVWHCGPRLLILDRLV